MTAVRLIPRLDVKGPNLIKGIRLEGLRVIGDPNEHALRYYEQGADELLFMDIVASLYGRNNLSHIIERAVKSVFIPITVGGGIRSVEDALHMLRCGADKIAINTAAIARPELISEIARALGSQCMVLSIEAKAREAGKWEAYTDNGRERTGLDAVEWARQAVRLGAGEILVTAVDREGTRQGFDCELIRAISDAVPVPVIASGGMGKVEDAAEAVVAGHADAVSMADILHYKRATIGEVREALSPPSAGGRLGGRSLLSKSPLPNPPPNGEGTKRVTVIDYGASNLLNVVRALEHVGASVEVTGKPEALASAEKLVFPGVGAFGNCMEALKKQNLIPAIKDIVASGKPFLGICVGMQVMFEAGEEFGEHAGLGIVKGRVTRIPASGARGPHKIPHIGWCELRPAQDWQGTIFEPLDGTNASAYFVHSYMGVPEAADRLATVDYDGVSVCAAIKRGNAYGCQFHPEKSGETGLAVLRRFMELPSSCAQAQDDVVVRYPDTSPAPTPTPVPDTCSIRRV